MHKKLTHFYTTGAKNFQVSFYAFRGIEFSAMFVRMMNGKAFCEQRVLLAKRRDKFPIGILSVNDGLLKMNLSVKVVRTVFPPPTRPPNAQNLESSFRETGKL